MKEKILRQMIDYCLFNQKLSDFVKRHYRALTGLKKKEIIALWYYAKQEARGLMCL